jgi:peptidoglycan/xylan/chitin deacetylase (PgdA/CDA1 family)
VDPAHHAAGLTEAAPNHNGRVRVALTFDAEHPDRPVGRPGAEEDLLSLLDDRGVRATFFLQGRWVESHPDLAARIAGAGHLVGNHSHFHARMPLLTDEGLRADIVQADRAIQAAAGVRPRPWFRCPWGHGARDPRVVMALRRQRYGHVGWDVVAEDWEPGRTADDLVRDVVAGARAAGDGAVVLLHAWPAQTLDALPAILRGLDGADLVTVADLAERDLSATADPGTAAENPV